MYFCISWLWDGGSLVVVQVLVLSLSGLWIFHCSQLSSLSLLEGDTAIFCIWLQISISSTRNLGWCFCVVRVWVFCFLFSKQIKWKKLQKCQHISIFTSNGSSNSEQNHMSFAGMAKKCDRRVYCDFQVVLHPRFYFCPFLGLFYSWMLMFSDCWGLIFSLLNSRHISFFLVWMFLNIFFYIRSNMQK